ncbi:hypothetical protein QQS21_009564 [Conoideocrella luteorostrata]|uniref:Cytochrome P450 n=1 Tax=Conoideocrella luteorostrata TaxID=1105319 RepID=A0AAJ0FQ70_9HYPO|nr:hypothetical protein QQS21_009564 [Conoideocrella luteorostrata]
MTQLFDAAQDYGISCTWVGTIPIVYLRDPAVIRQVLVLNSDSISRCGPDGRGPFGIAQRLTGDVTTNADGKNWHRWRTNLLKDFHSPAALNSLYDDILRIAKDHVRKMKDHKSGQDLRKTMEAYALDTVWYMALGSENVSESSGELLSVMSRYMNIVGNPSHLWRHSVRNFFLGKPFREPDYVEQSIRDDINKVIGKLLDQNIREINPEAPCDKGQRHRFLQRISKESGGSCQKPITEDVLTHAREVFYLGHEAASLLLFWAIYELSFHPEVIWKLRHHLRENWSNGCDPDLVTILKMPYLNAVVSEVLRLHPPISTTARMVTKPIVVETRGNEIVTLPQGSQIFSSIHLLHHDIQVWGDTAEEFLPERWTGNLANTRTNHCEYLPFLTGPRCCPSSGFVLLQIKTMLAVLILQVDVKLPGASEVGKIVGNVVRPDTILGYEICEILA